MDGGFWGVVRGDFPPLERWAYLDTAFVGLMPRQVREGYREWADEWYGFQVGGGTILEAWLARLGVLRRRLAALLGVSSREVAFTMCTGSGLNIVVNGIDWRRGDNVVFSEWEHNPLDTYTTRRHGVEPRVVPSSDGGFDLGDFERVVDDGTRLVQVSHVCYTNGFRFDLRGLAEVAHNHGAKVLVDATQAVGALQVDYKREGVDFVSAAPYKYLMGPAGLAFLYVEEGSIMELTPDRTGWKNQVWEGDNLEESVASGSAERFEYGTLNFQGVYALDRSLEYLEALGMERVEGRVLRLSRYLGERLLELGLDVWTPEGNRAPIVSFKHPRPERLAQSLRGLGVMVTGRRAHGGHVRASVHFYNDWGDVDRLVEGVAGFEGC